MPKLAGQKSETTFRNAKPRVRPYLIADGQGLNLLVSPDGNRRWVFRYRVDGKERKIAIRGGYPAVSVKEARQTSEEFRAALARGEDPAEVRKEEKAAAEERRSRTFEVVARSWWEKWRSDVVPVHADQTLQRLERDILPYIGPQPVADLRAADVLAPLRRVEARGALESAQRLLSTCGQIFRHAVGEGLVAMDPTRDLRGVLASPKASHFGALTDPQEVGGLLRAVEAYRGAPETRAALMLGILTFVRPGNLRAAEWSEFHDLENPTKAEWRIPGAKMKIRTARPFVVPLAPQAVAILDDLHPLTGAGKYVFPSARTSDRPMSNMAVLAALRRMGYTSDEMTGHGVRAMARTICHEVLGFAPEVIEEQLAHGKAGPLGGAYDRTTHMPERRRLMREWADYLDGLKAER
jgi:integrase